MKYLTFVTFEKDPKLRKSYSVYTKIMDWFADTYKRQPRCDVYIGFNGGVSSIVNLRWNNTEGHNDANIIFSFAGSMKAVMEE